MARLSGLTVDRTLLENARPSRPALGLRRKPCRKSLNALDIVLPQDHSEALAVLAYVRELIDWADGGARPADKQRSNVVRLVPP